MTIERVKRNKRDLICVIFGKEFLTLIFGCFSFALCAQNSDSSIHREPPRKESNITLQAYMRVIRSATGDVRMDQNLVTNFRINPWLRLECGLRFGETTEKFNAYYGYKLELQSKSFFKTVRIIARLSDKIVRYPEPSSSRSNYLFVAEARFNLSTSYSVLAAAGYVFTYGKSNVVDFKPMVGVGTKNYPAFKVGLRYKIQERSYFELVYGNYDVFNPYLPSMPFFQIYFDHQIRPQTALFASVRYQYDHYVDVPFNYFFNFGVKIQLSKRKG